MIDMELKWLGHASWLIKADGKNIYIDPYEGEYTKKADIILSTHHHDDHCKPDKIALIKKENTEIIAPPECGKKLNTKVLTLKPGEATKIDDILIEAVEAYNNKRFRSSGNPFHPKGIGVGYLVTVGGKTIYHTGDTDFIDEMKQLKNIDIMLVPSGGTYTMDNPEAAEATISINPKKAIPMHIWDTNPSAYKEVVEEGCNTEVIIMKPGETLNF
jgi:L-ascorbate metabolism protein UlaG (beta-lactamase superfamily)